MVFTVIILFLTLLVVSIALRKTALFSHAKRIKRRLEREGADADAVLLNVEQTGVYVNNQPQVKLQLQVHPPTGRNFVSEAFEVLSLIDKSRLRIGSTLKVKYNRANTKEVMVLRHGTTPSFPPGKNTRQ